MNDEFFIGYVPQIPNGIKKVVKRVIVALFVSAVLLSALLTIGQSRLTPTFFEFSKTTQLTGTVREHPYPMLQDAEPRSSGKSTYLLVAPGKFGAEAIVAGLDGARVRVVGKKIYRDGLAMIELAPAPVRSITGAAEVASAPVLGNDVTLTGEIVDSKCYYGVMNPGEGKVHRDCAARCLSGGVPPSFVVHGGDSDGSVYLLTDATGSPLRPSAFLDKVGEPVTVRAREVRNAPTAELRVGSIDRLP